MTPEEEGHAFERLFFGRSSNFDRAILPTFQSFGQSLLYVKEHQCFLDWNPFHPGTVESERLFEAIQDKLPRRLSRKLLLYSSIGTTLDVFHGIDGFFAIDGCDFIVSFDLVRTTHTWNKLSQKADFMVNPSDLNDWENFTYLSSKISQMLVLKKRSDWRA